MNLQLITLLGLKMDDDVYEVILPTASGPIAVYPGHEALVTLAVAGDIRVRRQKFDKDDLLEHFATGGGVAEIDNKRVRILVDDAESPDEIVEEEARAALERAEKLRAEAKDQVDIEHAQQMIDRHAVRLKVAEFKRRRYKG
jgi:F-type H+-transporting ATPase subunit epsilon